MSDLNTLIKNTIRDHKRIIFNGNNYSDDWVEEAEKRGLLNLKTTLMLFLISFIVKILNYLTKHHVFSESELYSRYEILMENYCKTIHIEALTMIDMVKKYIIPSVLSYQGEIAGIANSKKQLIPTLQCELEEKLLHNLSRLGNYLYAKLDTLETSVLNAKNHSDLLESAKYYRESIFINMQHLRGVVDELETLIGKDHWPLPTYGELLFSVN